MYALNGIFHQISGYSPWILEGEPCNKNFYKETLKKSAFFFNKGDTMKECRSRNGKKTTSQSEYHRDAKAVARQNSNMGYFGPYSKRGVYSARELVLQHYYRTTHLPISIYGFYNPF